MIFLNDIQAINVTESLFGKWEFWLAAFTVIGGFITNWYRQAGLVMVLKIEIENNEQKCDAKITNNEQKCDARINSMKEQLNRDRDSASENYKRLFDLCTKMNQRLDKVIDSKAK